MLRRRLIYGLALIISLGTFIAANNRAALILFGVLVCGALVSLVILALGKTTSVMIKVYPGATDKVSQHAKINIKVKGKTIFTLETIKLVLQYENCFFGETQSRTFFLRPGSNPVREYMWEWEDFDCGNYKFNAKKIVIYDMFGIWSLSVKSPEEIQMMSYPYVPEINATNNENSHRNNEGEKYDLYKQGNDVTEVHDLRDYHEGDSIGSIHWKLSGKLDKLVVREFGNPTNDKTAIYCDAAFAGYEDNHSSVNAVVGMTAAISEGMIRSGELHHISMVQKDEIISNPVLEERETLNAISNLLLLKLKEAKDVISVARISPITERVVLVTGAIEESLLTTLSEKTNLTVVLISDGNKEYVEDRETYRILSLPIAMLDKHVHQVEL